MKVSIGSRIVRGPWGGGNLFAINLTNFLKDKGHEVIYDLSEPDIDLILLTDPRSRSESSSTFNHEDIKNYKKFVKPNVAVVQRINECDERKNTENINNFYLDASKVADHVVFVSSWLRNIYLDIGMDRDKTSVILAGANNKIFNNLDLSIWEEGSKLKLVTHHWSSHKNKGFDVYEYIDQLLDNEYWKNKIEFTYIGNIPSNFQFRNTNLVDPLAGKELARELKRHHIYITGSINEPSGNHHIEAAQCGLPILYKDSGGIPEYCEGFGICFDNNNLEENISLIKNQYEVYIQKLKVYPFNSEKMCSDFLKLFNDIAEQKKLQVDKHKINYQKKYFYLMKNKILKYFRKLFSINLKSYLSSIVKKALKK